MPDHDKERKIPAILIAAGFVLYVLAAFIRTGSAGVGPTLIGVLVGGIIQTIILIGAAMLVATFLNVSFGDARTAALKFAGAALASGGLAAIIPFGGIVGLFVFLALIMWLFDLELTYAIVLTVIYFVINFVVALMLRAAIS